MREILVVGAGFAGATCAEQLAAKGSKVLVVDKRPHIAGNAFDELDVHGVLIHRYGPHIFHTNSKRIFEYLSRFTHWRHYEHRVLAEARDMLVPIPINRTTLNALYGLGLSEAEAADFIEQARTPRHPILNSEDVVLNSVGPELCDLFFRGYTKKQWGLDLSELSAGVAARIPTRSNDDDRYFTDTFQFMPSNGYTEMFSAMLDHPNITVELERDFADIDRSPFDHIIYTGPIDAYFCYRFGKLPYRSLQFEHEHFSDRDIFQQTGTVNYPNAHDYTRITEFKHLTGQAVPGTSIVKEYPMAEGEPYYPVPRPANDALFKQYKALADQEKDVTFVGRLAQYKYFNMDQVVGAALAAVADLT